MFRSFFICFFILSALTSKGAEVQINQKIADIPVDFLPELLNAAFDHAGRQAEAALTGYERAFYNNRTENSYAVERLLGKMKRGFAAARIVPVNGNQCSDLIYSKLDLARKIFCPSGIYTCVSDLSPPDSMKCFMER